jgi:hypothetical protein
MPVHSNRSASDLSLLGRLGAYSQHAKHPIAETTKAGLKAIWAKYEKQVDPDGSLLPEERARRAEAARRAHMARIALISAQKRRERAATSTNG